MLKGISDFTGDVVDLSKFEEDSEDENEKLKPGKKMKQEEEKKKKKPEKKMNSHTPKKKREEGRKLKKKSPKIMKLDTSKKKRKRKLEQRNPKKKPTLTRPKRPRKSVPQKPTKPYREQEGLDPKLIIEKRLTFNSPIHHSIYLRKPGILVTSNMSKYCYSKRQQRQFGRWVTRFGGENRILQFLQASSPTHFFILSQKELLYVDVTEKTKPRVIMKTSKNKSRSRACTCGACGEHEHDEELLQIFDAPKRGQYHIVYMNWDKKIHRDSRNYGGMGFTQNVLMNMFNSRVTFNITFHLKTIEIGRKTKKSKGGKGQAVFITRVLRDVSLRDLEIKELSTDILSDESVLNGMIRDRIKVVPSPRYYRTFYIRGYDCVRRYFINKDPDGGPFCDSRNLMIDHDPNYYVRRKVTKRIFSLNVFLDMNNNDVCVIGYCQKKDKSGSIFEFHCCSQKNEYLFDSRFDDISKSRIYSLNVRRQRGSCAEVYTCIGEYSARRYLIVGCKSGDVLIIRIDHLNNPKRGQTYHTKTILRPSMILPKRVEDEDEGEGENRSCSVDRIFFLKHYRKKDRLLFFALHREETRTIGSFVSTRDVVCKGNKIANLMVLNDIKERTEFLKFDVLLNETYDYIMCKNSLLRINMKNSSFEGIFKTFLLS